jgi:hypothetical protein
VAELQSEWVPTEDMAAEIVPMTNVFLTGIPLVFIAGVVVFQRAKNVPDARKARANTLLKLKGPFLISTLLPASSVDHCVVGRLDGDIILAVPTR